MPCTHGSNDGRQVTCDRCGNTYTCTPNADYYCTPAGDHSCEPCLISGLRLVVIDPATATTKEGP